MTFFADCNKGLAALVGVMAINMVVDVVATAILGMPDFVYDIRNAYPWLWMVGMWPSALFCWFYGKRAEEAARRETTELPGTSMGKTVWAVDLPEFLWLPVKWWAVVCLLLGVVLWQSYKHSLKKHLPSD